jgi:hypothetical protein
LALATPLQAQEPCKFSLVSDRPIPITAQGEAVVVQAVKVVDQPDSPLAITSLDLRGLTLNASSSHYTMEGAISVEVINISDMPVARIEFGRAAGWRDGYSSGKWSFGSQLGPGERRVFTFNGRTRGGTGQPDQLMVLVGMDVIFFGQCRYEPAVTASICGPWVGSKAVTPDADLIGATARSILRSPAPTTASRGRRFWPTARPALPESPHFPAALPQKPWRSSSGAPR